MVSCAPVDREAMLMGLEGSNNFAMVLVDGDGGEYAIRPGVVVVTLTRFVQQPSSRTLVCGRVA